MRPAFKATIALLTLTFSACELKVKPAKTPPAPQATVAKAEPPPVSPVSTEPLSIPQTQVRLPQPQPLDPDAVVPPPPPPEPVQPRQKKRGKVGAPPSTAAKPDTTETAEATPPTVETQPHRLEPVIPEDQRRQQIEEITARLSKADATLKGILAQPLTDGRKRAAGQIRSLADQAYKARDQGDIQKATGLVDRIQLLLQDLARGK